MNPLFLGNHPALDFLNTCLSPHGRVIEFIGDGQTFVSWLVRAGLLDRSTASKVKRNSSPETLDAAASEARMIRDWVGDWIGRWHEAPGNQYRKEVRRLNELLERAKGYREVVIAKDNMKIVERSCTDSAEDLTALIAVQVALLMTTEESALVKRCAGAGCTLWFLDRTKAHRRLFCSPTACGNRAKVAAFRERQRGSPNS
jgi:predicted RNA-binding Zn ribbon-like protein